MTLSDQALNLLKILFSEQSNLNLPVGYAEAVVEIQKWLKEQLKEEKNKN